MSAVQLARAFGAMQVFAVDIREESLDQAARYGAVPVDARSVDPVSEIRRLTGGRGIDVAVEALKDFSRMYRGGANELARFARICRVTRVMQPYLDAIA